jgi:phosphoserine aminotransferase
MISFYPGPSQVYDKVPQYIKEAHRAGVLSMNHRSIECMNLVKQTVAQLQKKLQVPKSYTVLFLSSATECWEVITQSLVQESSTHIYNGAFGKKWFDYTVALKPNTTAVVFDREMKLPIQPYPGEVLCLTQNETSNGTQVTMNSLKLLRQQNSDGIIAVDATSSMGGQVLDFSLADVWFASVQKCFGLPAGLAVMICSPRAVARVKELNEQAHYNSLVHQIEFAKKFQTTHTPNVLGIYLLYRVLQDSLSIKAIDKRLQQQALEWYKLLTQTEQLKPLITNATVQSTTVITVTSHLTNYIKSSMRKAGFLLGEGYGDLKTSTFRIANFPAIRPVAIRALMKQLAEY